MGNIVAGMAAEREVQSLRHFERRWVRAAVVLAVVSCHAGDVTDDSRPMGIDHLEAGSTLGDVLRHPAFSGFARHLLPWDGRSYDERLSLGQVGSLLPYHTHVDTAVTVAALNRMVDDAAAGRTIFYDVYSAAEMRSEPTKRNTGLFFVRGQPGAPFCVIAPGGGFSYVGSLHEGFPHASEISRFGYNAFVLKYRTGQGAEVATADLAAALAFVFRHAADLEVGTAGYSLWGSSAGARMAAAIGSHGTHSFGAPELPRPAMVVMAYTGHSDVGPNEPPTFVVVGENDYISPPATMRRRVDALRSAGTAVELREFPDVGHGFGLGVGTSAEGWVLDAVRFWERYAR
jgi:acetyl esterase/lipase